MQDFAPVCFFFLAAFIIGGVGALIFASARSRAKELNEVYGILARKFRGQLHSGDWFGRPSVTFDHRGHWARVDVHSTGGKNPTYYTQVHISWPQPGFRMEVYPEGFFYRLGKFLGMNDVEIGSPWFDREYIITGNDAGLLRETLTSDVQLMINELRNLAGGSQIYVSVRNYELLVKKQGLLDDAVSLEQLTDLTLQLHEAALAGQDKGIEFLETRMINPVLVDGDAAEEVVCQVCGDAITSDVVFCRSCQTPHHQDCWQYYGQCSTFGCGQRSYRHKSKKKSKRRN